MMNIRAEDIGTISRYAWYPEIAPAYHLSLRAGQTERAGKPTGRSPATITGFASHTASSTTDLDFYLYRDKRNLGQINLVGDLQTDTEDNVAVLAHDSEWIAPDRNALITDHRSYRWELLEDGELYLDTAISLRRRRSEGGLFTPPTNPGCR